MLVATKDDVATTLDDACRVTPGDNRTSPILGGAKTVRDGVTYRPFVSIKHGWTDDRTLTCSGPHLRERAGHPGQPDAAARADRPAGRSPGSAP